MSRTPIIGIDCRFAETHSGLGTYTRGLVMSLVSLADDITFVLFVRSLQEEWLSTLPQKNIRIVRADFSHYSFSEQCLFPRLIKRAGCIFFFAPQFNVPFFCPVPFACTVHDLILHHYPNQAHFLKRLAYRVLMRFAVTRARRVFTVSDATRLDLEQAYPGSAEKIHTVYPGIDHSRLSDPTKALRDLRDKYHLQSPYFLYVGNSKEHKNVTGLIDAFLSSPLLGHELILITGGAESSMLPSDPRVRIFSDVSSQELKAFFHGAVSLVTATKLEGFGLPILEAMANDCPVIATDVASIREISGGHAVLVSNDKQSLSTALIDASHTNASDREIGLPRAREHAETFTWDRSAKEILRYLRSAISSYFLP